MAEQWGTKMQEVRDHLREGRKAEATLWCLDTIRQLAEEEALTEAAALSNTNLGEDEKKIKKRRLQVKFSKLMPGARQGIHTLTADGVNFLTDEGEIDTLLTEYWSNIFGPPTSRRMPSKQ